MTTSKANSDHENESPRDPIYENARGRRASPERIALRRWIHQQWKKDREPLPGRFRYYEAIMAGVIDKHAAQAVQSTTGGQAVTKGDVLWKAELMWVRKNGLVPDSWIEDRTRKLYDFTGWDSVEEGLRDQLNGIALDPWGGRPPMLVVESESSAAALETVADDYRIRLAPLRGQAGRSYLANVVAPTMYDGQVVLAVVDLDKVGADIADSAHERLVKFHQRQHGSIVEFDWRNVALTDQQVADFGIVRVPRIDGRETKNAQTRMVAETEALGAVNLRTIITDELDALLPEPLIEIHDREQQQRDEILARLGAAT